MADKCFIWPGVKGAEFAVECKATTLFPNSYQIESTALVDCGWSFFFVGNYHRNAAIVNLSVGEFSTQFNAQMVRQLPLSADAFREQLENMVLSEQDYVYAKELGLDRQPRFGEDRRIFSGFQAMDLFVDENCPKVEVAPADVARYYEKHRNEFRSVRGIKARLLAFRTEEAAKAWAAKPADPTNASSDSIVELTEKHMAGWERYWQYLLRCPSGAHLGPIVSGDGYLVLIKQENLPPEQLPISEVAGRIVSVLNKHERDAWIDQFGSKLERDFRFEDSMDYAYLGLSATPFGRN